MCVCELVLTLQPSGTVQRSAYRRPTRHYIPLPDHYIDQASRVIAPSWSAQQFVAQHAITWSAPFFLCPISPPTSSTLGSSIELFHIESATGNSAAERIARERLAFAFHLPPFDWPNFGQLCTVYTGTARKRTKKS